MSAHPYTARSDAGRVTTLPVSPDRIMAIPRAAMAATVITSATAEK